MTWVNIPITFFLSEEFRGSEPIDRATWLALLAYCHAQENGGVVRDAVSWADRKWQQVAAVTLEETRRDCDLWHWDEHGDLHVHGYPVEKEFEVQVRREAGRSGGSAATEAKLEAARANGAKGGRPKTQASEPENPSKNPSSNRSSNPTERKGRERKGREESPPLWAVEKDLARARSDLSSFEAQELHYYWPPPDRKKTLKTKFGPTYEALKARISDLETLRLQAV